MEQPPCPSLAGTDGEVAIPGRAGHFINAQMEFAKGRFKSQFFTLQ